MSNRSKTGSIILILVVLVVIGILIYSKKNNSINIPKNAASNSILKIAIQGEPASLDPNLVNGIWESKVDADLFEGLTVKNNEDNIVPGVAYKWEVSPDKKTYTFYLRSNAKWSDGYPVTAHDFEFAMKRMLNPQTGASYANLSFIIEGAENYNSGKGKESDVKVKAIDNYRLQVTLVSPANYFPELVANSSFLPVPKHVVLAKGKDWSKAENIVSNGAYKLASWKPRAYLSAVKNQYYWDSINVQINNVIYYTQDDIAALLKRYRSNDLDILPNLSVEAYSWALDNIKNEILSYPLMGVYYYAINMKDDKFKNPKLRMALNMAIDRNFITNKVLKLPELPVAYSLVPKTKGYTSPSPEWTGWSMEKRISEAKKLLEEAGYNSKNPLYFNISYNTLEANKQIAVAIGSMWKGIGVNVSLFNKEIAVHFSDMNSGNFEIGKASWVADYGDISTFMFLFISKSSNNLPKFSSPYYDKEFWLAVKSSNAKEAMGHYYNAEKDLLNSNAVIPLYYYVGKVLVKPWVKGYKPSKTDTHLIKFMYFSN